MEVGRKEKDRIKWRLGRRRKKGWNGGWEEGEIQYQMEVERKGKYMMEWGGVGKRGKILSNGGWEERDRKDGMEIGRKG
jgi:hypothetical protein